jgi:hypothetical protein
MDRTTCIRRSLNILSKPFFTQKQPKCGVLHSDPVVVGRKSGPPKITHADICSIATADKPYEPVDIDAESRQDNTQTANFPHKV